MIFERLKHIVIMMLAVGMLAGCSNGDLSDLQVYIDEIKASRKGKVPPLPEFKPIESFAYSMEEGVDPFLSWEIRAAQAVQLTQQSSKDNGIQPDLGRRREPLETFSLDALRMVGTLQRDEEQAALVASPDGLVSRVVVGNYVGQNHGRVTAVMPDKVDIIEIVPDGLGGWLRRPASLALIEAVNR